MYRKQNQYYKYRSKMLKTLLIRYKNNQSLNKRVVKKKKKKKRVIFVLVDLHIIIYTISLRENNNLYVFDDIR